MALPLFAALTFVVTLLVPTYGWYVPGIAPVEYKRGDSIEVKAVKMISSRTQLPYDYYSLPFCVPENKSIVYTSENLGEVLRGDRIVNTPFDVKMAEDVTCQLLCGSSDKPLFWTQAEQELVASRIEREYFIHLLVDGLPCVTKVEFPSSADTVVEEGFRLGFMKRSRAYINNHLKLILLYHQVSNEDKYRVVGFEVEPISIRREEMKFPYVNTQACDFIESMELKPQEVMDANGQNLELYFSYSVSWKPSEISWASRWDTYLIMTDVKIHWFSIINSIAIIFFLAGLVAIIIIRTLRRDIARYNSDTTFEEAIEQYGWKLVHGDVFRAPKYPQLFAAIIGSGVQVFFMALATILFAMLGMLSPAKRGALMTCAIFFYAIMGLAAGYISARLYKMMKGRRWKKAAFLTSTFYPGIVFGMCFFLNFFIWNKRSSGAVPFSTMLSLLFIWFGISVPLVYAGYYVGYTKKAMQNPVRINQIPRQIPEQPWYMKPCFSVLTAGVLPFGAVYIELFFIFTAIWQNQFYYLFGFLFLVFIILIICCAQISIIMIYFQLCAEDYHWWWKSLFISSASTVYVAAYAVYYFYVKLQITEVVPTLLYFGYTILMLVTYWLLTSAAGFFAVFAFVKEIYSAIKLD